MYNVNVKVRGTAPLMQHRFPMPDLTTVAKGSTKSTGAKDYTQEWRDYLYVNAKNQIYQPAVHFEMAMQKAAANFKVQGKRGKTYKDLFAMAVIVSPDQILHGIKAPDELDTDADKRLYLDARPVVVQRARVVRIRPVFKAGWELSFCIEVTDDELHPDVLQDVLTLAGKSIGVGDFRPRFGRFAVSHFVVNQ